MDPKDQKDKLCLHVEDANVKAISGQNDIF